MFYRVFFVFSFLALALLNASDIKNLDSFFGNFKQTITSDSKSVIEYNGKVFIKKSGKILWQYETPIKKNVYIDNNMAIVDEPELEQAIFTKLDNEINIIKLLNEAKKIDNENYVSTINGIKYNIKASADKVSKITYKDELDNQVAINFLNIVQNGEISDEIFKFIIPSNYDVIRK
ncbi:LolA-like outer membrane lipoprotein chaperone [Aliarcobacter cibarius]|jgi:outer membrane lipoprotein carrier protein|uniref:Cell envelope biogenesis protein LolA n=1 Tax=Aliarcobacter cibarius TaxID=255507 RepID=A0A5J6RGH1_9BACT|nr:LolA-like outer membrane lipoprotein chaperone [Aliarcobacter cibarius]QEZ89379.1 periplasmic outer membrane-specific lipoprotein chaperone [Aliarcobacter cibarius]QKJ27378.1 periplasmic outer membrane-specific lipoprotein chaperone [Aliarcobacter cibarius]TLS97058.1 cell envelope biogenesis protein LolA [Aliarcobacter cibarius]TLS97558.1 cell envelope biogenesis protein LolA [Aliarcobacter cibarius]TLT04270.1 cell envelope biogenesis protein LolA [Aliarcobacter cibarius]